MDAREPDSFGGRPPSDRATLRIATWLTTLLVLLAYGYVAAVCNVNRVDPQPQGYYALLTDALLSGQLHLKMEPDPRLLELENPYAGNQGVSRPHDMTFFEGKFYLCYGITPFLLVGGPWTAVFGTYLTDGMLTAALMVGAFLLSVLWFRAVCRRHRLDPGFSGTIGGVVMLGLGNFALFGVTSSTFYLPPIASAWCCAMAAIYAVERATAARTSHTQVFWLGFASLALGLMVGGRPNQIVALPWVIFPVLALCLRGATGPSPRALFWRATFWTIFPAAAVGLGLALYNMMRFADPFEFGQRYTMNPADVRDIVFLVPENFWPTLRLYLFGFTDHSIYFPFFRPHEPDVVGVVRYAPWLLLIGIAFVPRWGRLAGSYSEWFGRLAFIVGAAVANLGLLSFFVGANDRYILDFAPLLSLAALLGAMVLIEALRMMSARCLRRTLGAVALLLATISLFNAVMYTVSRLPTSSSRSAMEAWSNRAVASVESLWGVKYGALSMQVRFKPAPVGTIEPLLSTGATEGRTDLINVIHEAEGQIRLAYFHTGTGGPVSSPQTIDFDRTYQITIDIGSLYPPATHPVYDGWTPQMVRLAKSRIRVELDGQPVLNAFGAHYHADPDEVYLGRHGSAIQPTPPFSGIISDVRRLGVPDADAARNQPLQALRMELLFLPAADWVSQPLMAFGPELFGDTIYVTYLPNNRLRFGHDQNGAGAVETPIVYYDPNVPHLVEIDPGTVDGNLRIRFNQENLIDIARPFHPAVQAEVAWGFDLVESSVTDVMFTGSMLRVEEVDASGWKYRSGEQGVLRSGVKFPLGVSGLIEPLVASGVTGAGDFVYVKYTDDRRLIFGHDHWGVPPDESEPVPFDRGAPNNLEIYFPGLLSSQQLALLDEESRRDLENRVMIWLDDRLVYDGRREFHPTTPEQITPFKNTIGGSTCQPTFTGDVILQEQLTDLSKTQLWEQIQKARPATPPPPASQP